MDIMYVVIASYGSEECSWSENICVTTSEERARTIAEDMELAVLWAREKMPLLQKRWDDLRLKRIGGDSITMGPQIAIDLIAYAAELGAGEKELKILNIDTIRPEGSLYWPRTDASFSYEEIELI